MTYEEYLSRALSRRVLNPTERLGQAYFNVLYAVRPDLADRLIGDPMDPFYNDAKVPAFLEWVQFNW